MVMKPLLNYTSAADIMVEDDSVDLAFAWLSVFLMSKVNLTSAMGLLLSSHDTKVSMIIRMTNIGIVIFSW